MRASCRLEASRSRPAVRRAALLLCAAASCWLPAVAGAQSSVHRGMAVSPTVAMRIFVPAGRVRIAVWALDSIDVTGTVGATASVFGGGNREYAKFGVEPLRTGDTQLPEANWVVTVPTRAHVWVKVTSGAIETDGTLGDMELYAVGGSITVRRAGGTTSVESIDAAVNIESSRGDLRVRGGKARITLRNVTGTASITSVSGNVDVGGGSAPDSRIETIGGSIRVDVRQFRGSTLDLQTHSGSIAVIVDPSAVPVLDLASRTGVVTNELPRGAEALGRIVARSFRGGITVQRRTP